MRTRDPRDIARTNTKTDNANPASKLVLRRAFLRDLGTRKDPLRVFDACQGSGVLWSTLRREFRVKYWGVDVKPAKGRLKLDSLRVLNSPGWKFDVIDVDTYGEPWRHWDAILRNGDGQVTVFLTLGSQNLSTLGHTALRAVGLGPLIPMLPYGITHQLRNQVVDAMIAQAARHGWTIERYAESTRSVGPQGNGARYLGVRMTRK